jgi:hypothetical protein
MEHLRAFTLIAILCIFCACEDDGAGPDQPATPAPLDSLSFTSCTINYANIVDTTRGRRDTLAAATVEFSELEVEGFIITGTTYRVDDNSSGSEVWRGQLRAEFDPWSGRLLALFFSHSYEFERSSAGGSYDRTWSGALVRGEGFAQATGEAGTWIWQGAAQLNEFFYQFETHSGYSSYTPGWGTSSGSSETNSPAYAEQSTITVQFQ